MPYTRQNWQNRPSTATPLEAARLNHMEAGIEMAQETADTAVAAVQYTDVDPTRAEWDDEVYNAAVGTNDRGSWLGIRADGNASNQATDRLGTRLDERGWLDGSGGPRRPSMRSVTALTGVASVTDREYPRVVKPLTEPVLPFSSQPAASLLWLFPFVLPDGSMHCAYSTDHGTHNESGTFVADISDPLTPWTNARRVWRDDAGGIQHETPSLWYAPTAGKLRMAYQLMNIGTPGIPEDPPSYQAQLTLLAEADPADLTNWTRLGPITQTSLHTPGVGHTGYLKVFSYGGVLYGYSLGRGPATGINLLWTSHDEGLTWHRHPVPLGRDTIPTDQVPGFDADTWVSAHHNGAIFEWRGRPWLITTAGGSASGGIVLTRQLITMPLREDLRGPAAPPVDITPDPQPWEAGGISQIGTPLIHDGRAFVPYLSAHEDAAKSVGVMEIV